MGAQPEQDMPSPDRSMDMFPPAGLAHVLPFPCCRITVFRSWDTNALGPSDRMAWAQVEQSFRIVLFLSGRYGLYHTRMGL